MRDRRSWVRWATLFVVLVVSVAHPGGATAQPTDAVHSPYSLLDAKLSGLAGLRIPFVANAGQTDPAVAFLAQTFAGTIYVTKDGQIVYGLPNWSITERPIGGGGALTPPVGETPAQTRVSYFIGNDPSRWAPEIPTYDTVSLGEAWPGVSLSLRAYGKNVEKLFTVQPGADPSVIGMKV